MDLGEKREKYKTNEAERTMTRAERNVQIRRGMKQGDYYGILCDAPLRLQELLETLVPQ